MFFFVFLIVLVAITETLLCPIKKARKKPSNIVLGVVGVIIVLVATFRNPMLPDYSNYKDTFIFGGNPNMEPTILLISNFIISHNLSYLWGFFIYAVLGVSIKIIVFKKLSPFLWGSILVYLCSFYILHDLIQIRASVAAGILLYSLRYLKTKKYYKYIICIVIASLFHISALIMIPFPLLSVHKSYKWFYISLIPISYILYFLNINFGHLASLIPNSNFEILFKVYSEKVEDINVFNILQLIRISIAIWCCIKFNKIRNHYPLFVILYKFYILGIVVLVIFSDIPTMSFRINELLLTTETLVIPSLIYSIKAKYQLISKFMIITYSLSILFIYTFYTKIFF